MPDEQWADLATQHDLLQLEVLSPYDMAIARLACKEIDHPTMAVCWSLIAMAKVIDESGMVASGPLVSAAQIADLTDLTMGEVQRVMAWLGDEAASPLSLFGVSDRHPDGWYQLELQVLPARCESLALEAGPVAAPDGPQEAPPAIWIDGPEGSAPMTRLGWVRSMQFEVIDRRRSLGGPQA